MEQWGLAKDLFRTSGGGSGERKQKTQTRLIGATYNLTHFEGISVENKGEYRLERMGRRRKREDGLSGVCGNNKSTTEWVQGG
jgi:hypothetical protein